MKSLALTSAMNDIFDMSYTLRFSLMVDALLMAAQDACVWQPGKSALVLDSMWK